MSIFSFCVLSDVIIRIGKYQKKENNNKENHGKKLSNFYGWCKELKFKLNVVFHIQDYICAILSWPSPGIQKGLP